MCFKKKKNYYLPKIRFQFPLLGLFFNDAPKAWLPHRHTCIINHNSNRVHKGSKPKNTNTNIRATKNLLKPKGDSHKSKPGNIIAAVISIWWGRN